MANIKLDSTLLDMEMAPKQDEYLKNFIKGKASMVASLTKDKVEE